MCRSDNKEFYEKGYRVGHAEGYRKGLMNGIKKGEKLAFKNTKIGVVLGCNAPEDFLEDFGCNFAERLSTLNFADCCRCRFFIMKKIEQPGEGV